ncbi:MAG TPA: hypothetical protein VHE36_07375 [Sphingomicrobium sp.]|nr:hypothetical protein [Sphingomicrobium sp.]
MIRKLALAAAAALFASTAYAQAPPPPRLVVIIKVDQLSGDLFGEYRSQFADGFGRAASGTLFTNGSSAPGPALGDLAKAHSAASRSVAVSGDQASTGLGGRNVDQRWNWSGRSFGTNLAGARPPAVLSKVNAAVAAALAASRPPLQPSPFCQSRPARNQLARAAGDSAALAASPELDGATLALAAGLVEEMQLGRRSDPDVMSIDLSGTTNVIGTYGAQSQETCLQLTELDREIGDFLSLLDSRQIDYAVALEGGGTRFPIMFWRPGFRGATIASPVNSADMTATLATLIEIPASSSSGRCLEGTPAFCPQR